MGIARALAALGLVPCAVAGCGLPAAGLGPIGTDDASAMPDPMGMVLDGSPPADDGGGIKPSPGPDAAAPDAASGPIDAATPTDVYEASDGAKPPPPDAAPQPTIAFVQAVPVLSSGGPGMMITHLSTAEFMATSGDLLVLAGTWSPNGGSPSTATVTDSAGNVWTGLPAVANPGCVSNPSVTPGMVQLWYAEGAKGGADVVTLATSPDDSDLGFVVLEYSGVAPASALDTSGAAAAAAPSNTASPGAMTTTGTLDLVVAAFADLDGIGQMKAGPGYAARASDTSYYSFVEDNAPGAAASSTTPSATLAPMHMDDCWLAAGAAFKAR